MVLNLLTDLLEVKATESGNALNVGREPHQRAESLRFQRLAEIGEKRGNIRIALVQVVPERGPATKCNVASQQVGFSVATRRGDPDALAIRQTVELMKQPLPSVGPSEVGWTPLGLDAYR